MSAILVKNNDSLKCLKMSWGIGNINELPSKWLKYGVPRIVLNYLFVAGHRRIGLQGSNESYSTARSLISDVLIGSKVAIKEVMNCLRIGLLNRNRRNQEINSVQKRLLRQR